MNRRKKSSLIQSRFFKKIVKIKNLKILLVIGCMSLSVLVIFALITNVKQNKTVFVIDGREYKVNKVDRLTAYQREVQNFDQEVAATSLYEVIKQIIASEKAGYIFDQKLVDETIEKIALEGNVDNQKKNYYKNSIEIIAKKEIIDESMKPDISNNYKGYAFDVFFGQHLQYGPTFKPQGLNDSKLVADDKAYAQERARYYRQALIDKKLTPEQIIKELNSDRRLSILPKGDTSYSTGFGHGENKEIFYKDVQDFVRVQKNIGVSEIKVGTASLDSTSGNMADMYYFFVLLEKVPDKELDVISNYNNEFKKINARYIGY